MSAAQVPDDYDVPRHDVPRSGRSGFTIVEGRQVHYLEWGHGGLPGVLCLHGGGQTAYMYEELGAAIGRRYHLLAPDLPNHGDSDPMVDGFGPSGIAATLPALLDQFGLSRVALVGASLGGLSAIAFADAHPDRAAGIALIDVGHRLEPEGVRKIIDFMAAHESFASLEEAAAEIAKYLPQRKDVRPESLTRNLRQRSDGRWEWKHGFGRRFRGLPRESHPADNLDTFLAGVEESAARLTCPVLVLRGAASDVLSQQGAEEVAALIPNARLETVEKAGHLAAGDNPHSTVNLVSSFLDELRWEAAPPHPRS
ncbi:alpha/beta fold hydrolase [Rhabdothermincola sediminis]|uniref:alpha/beta fold hydrolase n=1 Tax=Rhabdothermincola sediminis TaxID=2751370 RepID=UPI001AA01291|nr:alpha/beta hydrolase [Rhabdothermincola sediminis]